MRLLDANNVDDYLRVTRRIKPDAKVRVELLGGGVSNIVLRVEPEGVRPFVIKQARERLRTQAAWFSRLDRIWREMAVMAVVSRLLPAGAIPRILFEDRENYLFAMEAVDPEHVVWKKELLAGCVRPEVAVRLAQYLSAIHSGTHRDSRIEQEFEDQTVFAELRVNPFYRHIARVHPDLAPRIEALIDEMERTRACLVHADFSPKNVLLIDTGPPANGRLGARSQGSGGEMRVHPAAIEFAEASPNGLQVTLVDFETGHYGDPAFDLGFFLSHLVLKGIRATGAADQYLRLAGIFWENYQAGVASCSDDPAFGSAALERRAAAHLAGCALARVDGTSPVDYLPHTEQREIVRRLCRRVLLEGIGELGAVYSLVTSLGQ